MAVLPLSEAARSTVVSFVLKWLLLTSSTLKILIFLTIEGDTKSGVKIIIPKI